MDLSDLILLATAQAGESVADPGLAGMFGLDWRLFVAQLVNFGIILFILWKWVFRPVGGALEDRRRKIEESVRKAEQIEQRMKEFEDSREKKMRQARVEAEAIVAKAGAAAEAAKNETVVKAREEAERILETARKKIEAERENIMKEVREEVAEITVLAAGKLLREKLDDKKDREFVEKVIKELP